MERSGAAADVEDFGGTRRFAPHGRYYRLRHVLEMIRFSHTLFALPFALLAAAMAWKLNFSETPPRAFRWLDLVGILHAAFELSD